MLFGICFFVVLGLKVSHYCAQCLQQLDGLFFSGRLWGFVCKSVDSQENWFFSVISQLDNLQFSVKWWRQNRMLLNKVFSGTHILPLNEPPPSWGFPFSSPTERAISPYAFDGNISLCFQSWGRWFCCLPTNKKYKLAPVKNDDTTYHRGIHFWLKTQLSSVIEQSIGEWLWLWAHHLNFRGWIPNLSLPSPVTLAIPCLFRSFRFLTCETGVLLLESRWLSLPLRNSEGQEPACFILPTPRNLTCLHLGIPIQALHSRNGPRMNHCCTTRELARNVGS